MPVLGIEPAANVAEAARRRNVPTLVEFFGIELAERLVAEGKRADLIIGNNVLAQVPDLNDFVAGMARLLAPEGVITLEFPHLERLIEENQFDTIYHEHFSYFSLVDHRPSGRAARPQDHRRRGAPDPRRLAARLPGACRLRARAVRRASTSCSHARRALGFDEIDDLRALRRAGAARPSASCCRS